MKFARSFLIFSYGLFTIAAQSLIFREFITSFEGNDISVAIFFASWFLWVGAGAMLAYKASGFADKVLRNIEFLFLGYLPAFALQFILIIQARELIGVESYALLSIRAVLFLSLIVNAPVSIITGILFPTACRWVQQQAKLAISHVYIIEAAGSFTGGLGVTVLLALGVSSAEIFFILSFIVSLSPFIIQLAKAGPVLRRLGGFRAQLAFLAPFLILFSLVFGVDRALMRYIRVMKWAKLLPESAFVGSFRTAQAEYLYGIYHEQWVAIREGSVCETLPDRTTAGRIAAIALCQNPAARRVLVIGSGLGLCSELLHLPQIEHVAWTHYDSQYVRRVNDFIPPQFKLTDKRFHQPAEDVRVWLAGKRRYYDIVILNLPDATSSVLNRYYTHQFYRCIKDSLRDDGLLSVRVTGGENIMGTELINLGASTKLTLEKVFSRIVLTPGEDTWFIASDSQNLTGDPNTLRDRFAAIKAGGGVFSAEALLSVYLPNRAAAALESYSGADLPEAFLVNSDTRPLTHLYSILFAAKQSGAAFTVFIKHLLPAGPLTFVVPILVFVLLRVIYIRSKAQQPGEAGGFDSSFLVFSAAPVGIGTVIVLMYLYQTRFGSLYLYVGLISSLFMMGMTTGAALISYFLASRSCRGSRLAACLFVAVFVNSLILAAIACWPLEQWTHAVFATGFALSGLCAGCYFPIAARQLADSAFQIGRAAGTLETADHLGAAAGSLITGLVLVPVLGARITLFVFVLLLFANLPAAVLMVRMPERFYFSTATGFRLRRAGYILFGIGLSVILCSNLLAFAGRGLNPALSRYSAQALAPDAQLERVEVHGNTRNFNYFKVYQPEEPQPEPAGYVFSSQDFAPDVRGFGGTMNLAVYVDSSGRLLNFHIIRSNETPEYLELLSGWRDLLKGRLLFQPKPFAGVDAVTGATVSSEAVLSALRTSAHSFANQVLGSNIAGTAGRENEDVARWMRYLPDAPGLYLLGAFALALVVIYHGRFWPRVVVLVFSLVVGGIILNAQYSTEQIATVLSLHSPAVGLSGVFLLVVGVPVLVMLFGNIYCGYICPFGAAQELLGYIVPERFKPSVSADEMRKARFAKYVVLFVLVLVFFLSRNRTTLTADPLISIFSLRFTIHDLQLPLLFIAAIALLVSCFYTRFWCLYLCPTGAFLSLLSGIGLLKKRLPAKWFARCEFGLSTTDRLDCLYCDRCRYKPKPVLHIRQDKGRYLLAAALLAAVFVSVISVNSFLEVAPGSIEYRSATLSSAGKPRDVDIHRIRSMIQQGKLSDQEAQFYEKNE
jgi:predicted membrane-bound spermidine synthase/Na+-translocating ferredoxin:NAD+ oxidoreductase RnfG subunit